MPGRTAQTGRHARPPARKAGPVTAAFSIANRKWSKPSRVIACAWPAVPPLCLIRPAMHDLILRYADTVLGYDAMLCLIACLAVTPFITVARLKITRLRWWYGVWVFVLGAAGLAIHMVYGPGDMQQRVAGDAVNWSGMLIVVLLLPMAATSSVTAQKLLGPEWKRWQRGLVWVVWALVGGHLALMHAWGVLWSYGAATLPAVLLRRPRVRRAVKQWRGSGYSTGGWWSMLALLAAVAVAGLTVILTKEGLAVAHAITLAARS